MRIAIIGRSEVLYETALRLKRDGHDIVLVMTAKEAPEYTRSLNDFRILADQIGAAFIHSPGVTASTQAVVEQIEKIDIGISMNYTGVVPQNFIDLFAYGILNAHGGDLPRYRGNACQAWAIINGEEKVGLCIHRMVGGELDSGDIICRAYMTLNLETKITSIYEWIAGQVPDLFAQALGALSGNPNYVLQVQSLNPQESLRCYPRTPSDGRIDWSKSNIGIMRLINACNKPYAGAFCQFNNESLVIWDAELAPSENFLAIPGQITAVTDLYVDVACGAGKLRVKQIEYLGQTVLPGTLLRSLRARLS